MKKRPVKRRRGFSMTELLVVIAILIVLATLLIPKLQRVRAKAKQRVCGSNLRNLAGAMIMYTGENSGLFPPHAGEQSADPESWWGYDGTNRDENKPPQGEIFVYLDDEEIFRCPTLTSSESPESNVRLSWKLTAHDVGYGYNAYFLGRYDGRPADETTSPPLLEGGIQTEWRFNIAAVGDSSRTIMLGDSTARSGAHGDSFVMWWPLTAENNNHGVYPRHLDIANVTMVDQSVRSYGLDEMYEGGGHAKLSLWDPRHPR